MSCIVSVAKSPPVKETSETYVHLFLCPGIPTVYEATNHFLKKILRDYCFYVNFKLETDNQVKFIPSNKSKKYLFPKKQFL